ncbi:transcription termination/antitermination protein NusG [Halovulum sp. GXIMD14793]
MGKHENWNDRPDEGVWYALRTVPQKEATAQCLLTGALRPIEMKGKTKDGLDKIYIPQARLLPRREGNGLVVVCPLETKWRYPNKTARRKRLTQRPLMRGWLFVRFPSARVNWFAIRQLGVITGVAGGSGSPCALNVRGRRFLGRIVEREQAGHFGAEPQEAFMQSRCEFTVGDKAEVMSGPLAGFVVDVQQISGQAAKVIGPFMGTDTEMTVSLANLAKAG